MYIRHKGSLVFVSHLEAHGYLYPPSIGRLGVAYKSVTIGVISTANLQVQAVLGFERVGIRV